MTRRVTKEQIRAVRKADLRQFLLTHHADTVKQKGSSLIHAKYESLEIGSNGQWHRFSSGESGNAIDYLCQYLNLDLVSAVEKLAPYAPSYPTTVTPTTVTPVKQLVQPTSATQIKESAPTEQLVSSEQSEQPPKPLKLPEKTGNTHQMYAYLIQKRGFNREFVYWLIKQELAYQEKAHNNIVWVNKAKTFAEMCGTTDKRFKSIVSGSEPGEYWSFSSGDTPKHLYICESVIDACSLYLIQSIKMTEQGKVIETEYPAVYCSLSGLKDKTLEKILSDFPDIPKENIVLAIDNDPPADNFASKYPDIRRIKPSKNRKWKDWNDQLKSYNMPKTA